jgi:hypothetical protein
MNIFEVSSGLIKRMKNFFFSFGWSPEKNKFSLLAN